MLHESLFVDLEDFAIKKKLGEGKFGKVYLVEEKETGQEAFSKEITAISIVKNAATLRIKGFNSIKESTLIEYNHLSKK